MRVKTQVETTSNFALGRCYKISTDLPESIRCIAHLCRTLISDDSMEALTPQMFLQADAEELEKYIDISSSPIPTLIWFHCPWIKSDRENPDKNQETRKLIQNFIASAAYQQRVGDYLVLGLCTRKWYYLERYDFPAAHALAMSMGYKVIGKDPDTTRELKRHGYVHNSEAYNKPLDVEESTELIIFQRER